MSKPFRKFSIGSIQVAVWENEGKHSQFYTVTISRRFKGDGEEWKNSQSLRLSDVPKAIIALQEAYRQLALREFSQETSQETDEPL